MNVDEVAFKKGHRYITVISDRDGRALALTDDRGTESCRGYLRTLTDGQLLAIKTLSMDMNAGYIRAARIHLPSAVEKIAFDRFHVAKQLGEAVDKTRQNEHPHLPVESRHQAKGTRFLWQYSDKWMTEIPAGKADVAACTDEADEPVLGAERAGKGYLEQAMERGKTE